jgi:LysR family transcriptional regulator, transcriptional activator of the cysJI operon
MIRTFKIFCDLADTKSFSRAAERNYLTQPAVSQHIKVLETRFKTRLIERGGRQRFRLTVDGEKVYAAAREILKRMKELEKMLLKGPEVSGPLRVGTIYTVGLHELAPYMDEFIKRFPKVDLQLNYLGPREIRERVLSGRLDLGVVAYPKSHGGLRVQYFQKDRLVVIVWGKHSWADQRYVSLKDLHDQPFIAFASGIPTRTAIGNILKQYGVRPRIVHEFDNIEVIKRAVEVKTGISIVPFQTVIREVQKKMLVPLEIQEGSFERPIGVITRRKVEHSEGAKKFISLLLGLKKRSKSF